MEIILHELVIDDPEVMSLDTPYKVWFLFKCIEEVQEVLRDDFPHEKHMVFVKVGRTAIDGTLE